MHTQMAARTRTPSRHAPALLGVSALLGLALSAWPAQAQNAPEQTTQIQPRVSVTLYASHANNPPAGQPAGDELLVSVKPSVSFFKKGANSQIDGQGQLSVLHYTKGTQNDRVVPSGSLNLHSDFARSGMGVDAGISATQVKPTVTSVQSLTPSTSDTYTNTTVRVSPYLNRQIDQNTQVTARLDRALLHTSQVGNDLTPRPNSYTLADTVSLDRRPTPTGYGLAWQHQQTKVSGQSDPSLDEQILRGRLLYAPLPELELGLIAGAAHTNISGASITDHPKGWQAQWRPTDRSLLKTQVEQRFYGKAWSAEVSHRLPWLALDLTSERTESTYAAAVGSIAQSGSLRGLYNAMLTTRFPNEAERRAAVENLLARRDLSAQINTSGDVYDTGATVRQTTLLRVAFMGRRDIITLAGGLVKTAPLTLRDASLSLLAPSPITRSSYFDVQANHQLTLKTTLSGGLRWLRSVSAANSTATPQASRDFAMRASVTTSLTRDTKATMGLQRQISHNAIAPETTDEAAVFAGLDHRF